MTKSWSALPVGQTGVSLKAPSFKEYKVQAAEGWAPSRQLAEQTILAHAIMDMIDSEGLRVPLGQTYRLWRHPRGLAMELPSGWTVYMDLEGQVRQPGIAQKMRAEAAKKGGT